MKDTKYSPQRFLAFGVAAILGALCSAAEFEAGDELFTLKVQPILSEKCLGCHGEEPEKLKGEFDVRSREAFLLGGEYFGDEVLVPGDPKKSFLIDTIKWSDPDFEMPPKENDRLTGDQIADFERWIEMGAPWPDDETQLAIRQQEAKKAVTDEGMIVKTSGGTGDEWTFRRYDPEKIWAFLPVEKPEVPAHGELTHPIDAFLTEKLDEAGFGFAPEAEPRSLIRRVSYGLIGLPPTPNEIETFEAAWNDNADEAWSGLIDRLLASPHYGERWAQHWFDTARYADTGGMSNDYERSNAWRYRDYVIRAFNEDMPYDRFVREQLAGDELAHRSLKKRHKGDYNGFVKARANGDYTPEEAEQVIATGFLRMGPWDPAMVKNPEARQLFLDDVVNSVGQTFLATTMRCVKCHDHKFDPIPTRDYYRMYATFAGTQMAERPV
ncbi:MAG: DUF1549 domain-containing protein, partial [Verrucomicrobiota bacterium]